MTSGAQFRNNFDIYTGHAYALRGAVKMPNGDKLIAIRNPHGKEVYTGPYRDKDPIWNRAGFKEAAGKYMSSVDDGSWMIKVEDYRTIFDEFGILHYKNWNSAISMVVNKPMYSIKFDIKFDTT